MHALLGSLLLVCLAPQAWQGGASDKGSPRLVPQAAAGAADLQAALAQAAALDTAGQLRAINEFFNRRIAFRDDVEVWQLADHWASPLELLAKGEGDCEDFALAKYFTLRALGVPGSQLRLVYVQAQMPGSPGALQPHMVLAHFSAPGAVPSILDNLAPEVLSAAERSDLSPVFSFNGDGLWHGIGTQAAGDPRVRLSHWREVVAKARGEGFL